MLPFNYIIRAMPMSITLYLQVQQPRITKRCQIFFWLFCPESCSIRSCNTHQKTNSLIAWPLPGSPNCAWYYNLRLFRAKTFPYSNYYIGTIFNVIIYVAVSDRDSNLSPSRQRADELHVEPRSRVQIYRC